MWPAAVHSYRMSLCATHGCIDSETEDSLCSMSISVPRVRQDSVTLRLARAMAHLLHIS